MRRERDSNPRYPSGYTRFPGVPVKPLLHLSKNRAFFINFHQICYKTFQLRHKNLKKLDYL
jgi:hypothetical protein